MNLHKPHLFVCCLLILAGCVAVKNKQALLPPMPPEVKNSSKTTSRKSLAVKPSVSPVVKTNVTLLWTQNALTNKPLVFAVEHSQDLKTWSNLTNFGVPSNTTNYSVVLASTNKKDFFRVGVRYLDIVR